MRLFLSILLGTVLIGVLAFFLSPSIKEARRSKVIEAEIDSLRSQAEKIDAQNNFLREKIEYLKSDSYKESVAKDRLNLRNSGEKVVVIQPSSEDKYALGEDNDISRNIDSEDKKNDEPNYKKWLNIISNK